MNKTQFLKELRKIHKAERVKTQRIKHDTYRRVRNLRKRYIGR